jgi:hypothetical protein
MAVLRALALTVAIVLAAPAGARELEEELVYTWRLDGFLGAVVGLFLPNHGEGLLTLERLDEGRRRGELLITSRAEETEDFFRYGAEWEVASGRTLRAWSRQRWRGEEKSKEAEIEDEDVIDVATAIFLLRSHPPEETQRLEIWSDGKLYPVRVEPRESEWRTFEGETVQVRHLAVRPEQIPGRRVWKGELDLWLAGDAAATPVEILVAKKAARVRLQLIGRRSREKAGESPASGEPGGRVAP